MNRDGGRVTNSQSLSGRSGRWSIVAVLAGLAVALRLPDLGNPLLDLDDQFYALIGERMWSGALPYVDIWDRKPVGLFLIYALAAKAAADPHLGYYVFALVAAIATAFIIALAARRITGAGVMTALMAGAVYLVWIQLLGGRGGQTPLFYNGLIAGAAMATYLAIAQPGRGRWPAPAAMALAGLALQIKPTAVFEGCWFGIALMVTTWRGGARGIAWLGYGALLIAIALAPTLIAFASYAALGHAEAWWFANVESIFLRNMTTHGSSGEKLIGIGLVLAVPLAAALFGLTRWPSATRWFAIGWLATTVAGMLAVPPYFNHYALPLLVPIALLAGIGMGASRPFAMLVAVAGAGMLLWAGYPYWDETRTARERMAGMVRTINQHRGDGCLFAFSAPPIFYQATGSCLPTRYPFGPHLTLAYEAGAVGVDPVAEVARILAARPPVIVVGPPVAKDRNEAAYALVAAALSRDYTRVGNDPGFAIYARRPARISPPAHNPYTSPATRF